MSNVERSPERARSALAARTGPTARSTEPLPGYAVPARAASKLRDRRVSRKTRPMKCLVRGRQTDIPPRRLGREPEATAPPAPTIATGAEG